MKQTVYSLFSTHDDAHYAVQDLLSHGFTKDSISLAVHQDEIKPGEDGTLAEGGAITGLVSGVVSGTLLGALLGIGSVFILPTGLILAGPIAWTLAGAASGGATGTFIGGLVGLGIPKTEADYYAEGVQRGGTMVIVGVDDSNIETAEGILDRDGAVDITSLKQEFVKGDSLEYFEAGRTFVPEVSSESSTAVTEPSTRVNVL